MFIHALPLGGGYERNRCRRGNRQQRSEFGRASLFPLTHAVDATPSFYRQEEGEVGNEVGIARESRHRRFFRRATNGQRDREVAARGTFVSLLFLYLSLEAPKPRTRASAAFGTPSFRIPVAGPGGSSSNTLGETLSDIFGK
jgi:hypothetical protein